MTSVGKTVLITLLVIGLSASITCLLLPVTTQRGSAPSPVADVAGTIAIACALPVSFLMELIPIQIPGFLFIALPASVIGSAVFWAYLAELIARRVRSKRGEAQPAAGPDSRGGGG